MTAAPQNLRTVRTLLLDALQPYGLHPLSVGIVGDAAHRGGYHCGSDRVVTNDYSVHESARDKAGLTINASALDIGQFFRNGHNLRTFSVWLVAECAKGAPDTLDIREVIYSPDGATVKRWDRLGRRSSGDKSHLTHTHISFFRDATKAGRDLSPLFRRYLAIVEGKPQPAPKPAPKPVTKLGSRQLKRGMSGDDVRELQTMLNARGAKLAVDGEFGPKTENAVKAFQRLHMLNPNGEVGGLTLPAIRTGFGRRVLRAGNAGSDVAELQRRLTRHGFKVDADGEFGPKTKAATTAFQRARKLKVDGIAGKQTITALRK
ncbi:peptidoglycan-binding protein [Micromonospora sp. WMMD1082]|uniref:peptidoglycan-binding domain-containing protein n=1 Tax=Micromonospora sp. WMMD1082 TaxID=3016104 RepID=UPI002415976E|nr:peptidoglycan-binding protein [Micromonospora sp. WMMD1082]MDG4792708.1 peptidoglycan-binding protein [Micromonospora sp. WMMD1082]